MERRVEDRGNGQDSQPVVKLPRALIEIEVPKEDRGLMAEAREGPSQLHNVRLLESVRVTDKGRNPRPEERPRSEIRRGSNRVDQDNVQRIAPLLKGPWSPSCRRSLPPRLTSR